VAVSDGRLTSVTGNPDHPFTQGVICGKVREYAERVHSPLRVLRPLRRVGPKGAGEFMPMSWDDAKWRAGDFRRYRPTCRSRRVQTIAS
jgi:anaerobic selenocysteine-containing dehydrogenase